METPQTTTPEAEAIDGLARLYSVLEPLGLTAIVDAFITVGGLDAARAECEREQAWEASHA